MLPASPQLHDNKLKVDGETLHPLAGVPDALEALRLKAARKRMSKKYDNEKALSALVRIQALGRKKLARASTKMIKASRALG